MVEYILKIIPFFLYHFINITTILYLENSLYLGKIEKLQKTHKYDSKRCKYNK